MNGTINATRQFARSFMPVVLAVLACFSGCTAINPEWKWPGKSEPQIPQIVLPIWTDTVLHQPGKPGVRGFGGRVFLYAKEGADPIKVDGALSVYVFDDEDAVTGNAKPLRKFVITADQLSDHYSASDLGASYSVWIPWEVVGGPSRSLSLITRFDGRNGGTAISEASNKLLPGTSKKVAESEQDVAPNYIQQASFTATQHEPEDDSPREKDLKTYSLALPPSFQRHLRGDSRMDDEIQRAGAPAKINATQSSENRQQRSATSERSQEAAEAEVQDDPVPTADSQPVRFPARREPTSQRGPSRIRRLPHPAGWPSSLPPTPRSAAAKPIGPTSAPAP
jgi:hypothetical protein